MRVEPSPATKDAREWFDEFDTDRSGELDGGEVAALYRQARGESLSKRQLAAAMDVMDTDGSGAVDFAEFESWWHEHGGDLEKYRELAFTLVIGAGVQLLVVAPDEAAKQRWVSGLGALLQQRQEEEEDQAAARAEEEVARIAAAPLPEGWEEGRLDDGSAFYFRTDNPADVLWTRPDLPAHLHQAAATAVEAVEASPRERQDGRDGIQLMLEPQSPSAGSSRGGGGGGGWVEPGSLDGVTLPEGVPKRLVRRRRKRRSSSSPSPSARSAASEDDEDGGGHITLDGALQLARRAMEDYRRDPEDRDRRQRALTRLAVRPPPAPALPNRLDLLSVWRSCVQGAEGALRRALSDAAADGHAGAALRPTLQKRLRATTKRRSAPATP